MDKNSVQDNRTTYAEEDICTVVENVTESDKNSVEEVFGSKREENENSDLKIEKCNEKYEVKRDEPLVSKKASFDEKHGFDRNGSIFIDEDTVCGIGSFRPQWLQSFATPRVYLILFSIVGILHGCYHSYVIGSFSTLEKRFGFDSKISGIIIFADETVPLFLGIAVGYYAGNAHRPRMVALGILLTAGCAFLSSLPYFIYGPASAKYLTFEDAESNKGPEFCHPDSGTESCDATGRPQTLTAVLLFVFGSVLKGFGNLVCYAIGLAYLDDISGKKTTPIYLAFVTALKMLGPVIGYLMSSIFLKIYENPSDDPGFGPEDPRWIGAWWLGFILQTILLVIFALPLGLFPRRLPGQKRIETAAPSATVDGLRTKLIGILSALKRLGKNPFFVVYIFNDTLKIFALLGHGMMMPKYMEIQFRLSASEASLYSGATSLTIGIVSTLLGGFLVWKFRPSIKVILLAMLTADIILSVGYLILMIPRCQTSDMSHFGLDEEGLILNSVCNQNCDCSTTTFTPYCGPDSKVTYFSPCYAGCTQELNSSMSSEQHKRFGNCSCVADGGQPQMATFISEGYCTDENCWTQAKTYLIIHYILMGIAAHFAVVFEVLLLRSVHPRDKNFAMGTFEAFVCLFGLIPCPITFGALVDSACLVWEKSCGEKGNCWFYDVEKFNYLLHGAAAFFCSVSVIFRIALYCLRSHAQDLYEEEEEEHDHNSIKLDNVSGTLTKL